MRPREEHRPADRRRQEEREEARYSADRSLAAPGEAEALRERLAAAEKVIERQTGMLQAVAEEVDPPPDESGVWSGTLAEAVKAMAEERDKLRAEAAELRQHLDDMARQWRPIETAPKDGTHVLTWNGRWIDVGYWSRPGIHNPPSWISGRGISHIDQPTHWQPLPKTPDELDRMLDGEATAEGGEP